MKTTIGALRQILKEEIYDPTGRWAAEKSAASAFADRVADRYGPMAGLRAIGEAIGSTDPEAFADMYLRKNGGDPLTALHSAARRYHPNKLRKAEALLGESDVVAPRLARLF